MSKGISIVIPAFNESKMIAQVISQVNVFAEHIIVVDDGSEDKTADLALQAGAKVLIRTKNQGYDASLRDGIKEALHFNTKVVITFDADNQHAPKYITMFANAILNQEADVVIGQRSVMPYFFEKIFSLYSKARFGIDDPLCGLKAYSRKICETLDLNRLDGSVGTYLLFKAVTLGYKVQSVPVEVTPRKDHSRFYGHYFRANFMLMRGILRAIKDFAVGVR